MRFPEWHLASQIERDQQLFASPAINVSCHKRDWRDGLIGAAK